ncbi:MAG: hypothetical protein ACLPZR_26290 [Solirubrobacteraceae bacterium]
MSAPVQASHRPPRLHRGRRRSIRAAITAAALGGLAGAAVLSPPADASSAGAHASDARGRSAATHERAETAGGLLHTWTDYLDAGGKPGPSIAAHETVQVACRVQGFRVQDGNVWWYRIASRPWDNRYYVSADGFYNNGRKSGSLLHTPFVDRGVSRC